MLSRLAATLALASCLAQTATLPADEPTAAQLEFFEKKVRPLLAFNCIPCHGPEEQNAHLRLDHISTILNGGDTGPAIVPGEPAKSLLIEAINYRSLQMPPLGKLPPEEIAILTRWIEEGAAWPDEALPGATDPAPTFDLEARKQHWSFQPIDPAPPVPLADRAWPRDLLDSYILARLEEAQLRPALPADRRTLIRRVYFDLVGLPPTPAAVKQFLADDSPGAFARVVDGLLASPRFGERWGRHWLDVVRFGETYGHEFDWRIPHAWRYRDYVVRAINADVPYNDFVREHIAGDLLKNPRHDPASGVNESIIATGFWHLHAETHAPVDVRQAEAIRHEDQIDVFGKAFLGLTIACARCHDHKFDPITAADYYALAGFLRSSRRQIAALDPGGAIGETVEAIAQLRKKAAEYRRRTLTAQTRPVAAIQPSAKTASANRSFLAGTEMFEDFSEIDDWIPGGWAFNRRQPIGGIETGPAEIAGSVDSRRLALPLVGSLRSDDFTIEHQAVWIRAAGENARIRLVVDGYQMDVFSPLLFEGLTRKVDTKGEWVWIQIAGDLKNHLGHRGYFELLDDGEGWLAVDEIRFSNDVELAAPSGQVRPVAHFDADENQAAATALAKAKDLDAQADALARNLPEPVRVLAMQEGFGCDEELFIRGSHQRTDGPVGRRFLEALAGPVQPAIVTGSGRLQLANRLLADDNPLPARVMVNRVWHHLFGRGIVASVDNLGVLGKDPTHPELLDHLASVFRANGWSVKQLIRRIVLSRTYRMSSTPHPATRARAKRTDPTNLLSYAQRIGRLEGEAIRDAILAASGELNETIGGDSVPVHLTDFSQGRGRPETSGPLDGDGRRSLYIRVQRNFLTPMLTVFDFPMPATSVGRRNVSNVPAQALILLNDPFVMEQSRKWAARLLSGGDQPPESHIQALYATAYGRNPTPEDTELAVAYLKAVGGDDWRSDQEAWADYCHVLINGKEFVFVR